MDFTRKKVYYKVLKRKNKYYLTLVQRHKYLFENKLIRFVPNQSTLTNKKYDAIYIDKNKLLKLILSKGLNPATQIMTSVFNASPDLKKFDDILAYSQSIAMMAKPKAEKSQNPYLLGANKKPVIIVPKLLKIKAQRGINKVLRWSGLKEIPDVPQYPDRAAKFPFPRFIRRKADPRICYGPHLGPKGFDMYRLEEYRTRRGYGYPFQPRFTRQRKRPLTIEQKRIRFNKKILFPNRPK